MDERILFAQFHEALDIEPRPGASERLRVALTSHPVALKQRPAYRMRWSKMGLRVAAVLAATVIAIALGAAIVATHHGPTGSVPAGSDPNVKAYQAMTKSDYNTFVLSTSSHCGTIDDTGCADAVKAVVHTLQAWGNDLASYKTPQQFAVMDGQLRRHLNAASSDLNAAVAFQKAKNLNGFENAMAAALHEHDWIDSAFLAMAVTYPSVHGSFHQALTSTRTYLDECVSATSQSDSVCQPLPVKQECGGAGGWICGTDVGFAANNVETLLSDLLFFPAPSQLTANDARLQDDLARADTALLSMNVALLNADSATAAAAKATFAAAIVAADGDARALGNA